MREIQLQLPESLARRLDRRIGRIDDPSELLCALIETALRQDDAPDARGAPVTLSVRLDPDDVRALERERVRVGLTRAEWIRACLRSQLSSIRQFGRQDRGYLRRAVEDLKAMRAQVRRLRWTGAREGANDLADWAAIQALGRLEARLVALAEAIGEGFRGNDAYWRRLKASDPVGPHADVLPPARVDARRRAAG